MSEDHNLVEALFHTSIKDGVKVNTPAAREAREARRDGAGAAPRPVERREGGLHTEYVLEYQPTLVSGIVRAGREGAIRCKRNGPSIRPDATRASFTIRLKLTTCQAFFSDSMLHPTGTLRWALRLWRQGCPLLGAARGATSARKARRCTTTATPRRRCRQTAFPSFRPCRSQSVPMPPPLSIIHHARSPSGRPCA